MFGPERELQVVSVFSGAGGLDVGLARVEGMRLLGCVELEPTFCRTLEANRDAGRFGEPGTRIIQADLAQLSPPELMRALKIGRGEVDVLVGGPPCQAFSTAGRRRSLADPRGSLLWHFMELVVALQPRFFLMENVRGLLSAALRHRPIAERPDRGGPPLEAEEQPGSVVAQWVDDLRRRCNSYRVDCFEVNAVNYGAPQLRERALFIGNREGKQVEFPAPTHGPCDAGTGAPPPGQLPFATLGEALTGFHESSPEILDFSPRKKGYLRLVPPGGNWRTLPPRIAQESMGRAYFAKGGRSGWWRRLSWDLPCPTVVTMPNHASTSMCHPTETRALSVGEFARVQGFPDGWNFCGTVAEQMTQVGNAVPTRLGEVAGQVIVDALRSRATTPDAPPFRRVYLRSHVRTRQWFRRGETFVWDGPGGSARYAPAAA